VWRGFFIAAAFAGPGDLATDSAGPFLKEKPLQPGKEAGEHNGKRYKNYGRQSFMLLQPISGRHVGKGRTTGMQDASHGGN
jgi:hypothetical protein